MAAPTYVQEAETTWNNNADITASITTASFSVVAGDILVAFGIVSDESPELTISGGTLTWATQQTVSVTDYCYIIIATATVDVNKSMTVTFTRTVDPGSAIFYGGNVLTFRDSDGVGASSKTNVSSGAPTLNITTTQANSAIVVASGDWNATDGVSRVWRTGAGALTERTYFRDAAQYTVYGGNHADAGGIGTYAVGQSAPTGQKYSIVAVEIKGTVGGGGGPVRTPLTLLGVGV